MGRASWIWTGLEDYRQELARAPDQLTAEAGDILRDQARATVAQLRAAYPYRTGRLRRGVQIEERPGGALVRNVAPYAMLYEYGRGGRAGGKTYYAVVLPRRHEALRQIIALLEGPRYGGTVTDAGGE
jgi:hypothetical protein